MSDHQLSLIELPPIQASGKKRKPWISYEDLGKCARNAPFEGNLSRNYFIINGEMGWSHYVRPIGGNADASARKWFLDSYETAGLYVLMRTSPDKFWITYPHELEVDEGHWTDNEVTNEKILVQQAEAWAAKRWYRCKDLAIISAVTV